MNKIQFKSRKEASKFLKTKGIDTSGWTEKEWQSINKSQAEIHIQALAEAMWDAMNESTPKKLKSGEWHLPFSDKINDGKLAQSISPNKALIYNNLTLEDLRLKVCVSRCARLSYMTFDGEIDYEKDIRLHDKLLADNHCFDENTEILTAKGWKFFREITPESLIAQVDTKTGEFCGLSKPINIIAKNYSGKVYKYDSKNIDLFITEGHKLLGVPINITSDRLKSYESLEIFEANKIRVAASSQARLKFKTYGEQEMKMFSAPKPKKINYLNKKYLYGCLSGFFIGDGFRYSKNKVKFRLKKNRKIEYIFNILTNLSIPYTTKITYNGVTEIIFIDNGRLDIFYNKDGYKTIPNNITLNESFLYGLFDGLKNSDGSIKRNTWVYDTSSKELHDRVLDLCPLIGLTGYSNPSYTMQKMSKNQNTRYRIAFTTNNHILVNDGRTQDSKVSIEDYTGLVYCVEVPKQGIIVRRNGKTVITHNCSPFEHCARAMSDFEYNDAFDKQENGKLSLGWCNNFRGWVQYRYLVENK